MRPALPPFNPHDLEASVRALHRTLALVLLSSEGSQDLHATAVEVSRRLGLPPTVDGALCHCFAELPAPPDALTASPSALSVTLSWPHPLAPDGGQESSVKSFDLQRADDEAFTENVVTLTRVAGRSFVDERAGKNLPKYYRIRSVRDTGLVGDWSFPVLAAANTGIGSGDLQEPSVTTAHLYDDAITSQKLAEADGTTAQDANSGTGVKTAHLQDDAVTSAKLAEADDLTGQDTETGTGVKTAHLQNEAVTSAKLPPADGLTGQDLLTGSGVKTGHLQDLATFSSQGTTLDDPQSISGETVIATVTLSTDGGVVYVAGAFDTAMFTNTQTLAQIRLRKDSLTGTLLALNQAEEKGAPGGQTRLLCSTFGLDPSPASTQVYVLTAEVTNDLDVLHTKLVAINFKK